MKYMLSESVGAICFVPTLVETRYARNVQSQISQRELYRIEPHRASQLITSEGSVKLALPMVTRCVTIVLDYDSKCTTVIIDWR